MKFEDNLKFLIKDKHADEQDNIMLQYAMCKDAYMISEGLKEFRLDKEKIFDIHEFSQKCLNISNELSPHFFGIITEEIFSNNVKILDRKINNISGSIKDFKFKCSNPKCKDVAIKNSHTLQRAILKRLESNGGLFRFNVNFNNNIQLNLKTDFKESFNNFFIKTSSKIATTFPGFCKKCEINLFQELENFHGLNDVKELKSVNILLISWRSLCQALFFNCVKLLELLKEYRENYNKYDDVWISSTIKTRLTHVLSCFNEINNFEDIIFNKNSIQKYRNIVIENDTEITAIDFFEFKFVGDLRKSFHKRRSGIIFNELIVGNKRFVLLSGNFRSQKIKTIFSSLASGRSNPNKIIVNSILRKSFDFYISEDFKNSFMSDQSTRQNVFMALCQSDVPFDEFIHGLECFLPISKYGKAFLI